MIIVFSVLNLSVFNNGTQGALRPFYLESSAALTRNFFLKTPWVTSFSRKKKKKSLQERGTHVLKTAPKSVTIKSYFNFWVTKMIMGTCLSWQWSNCIT